MAGRSKIDLLDKDIRVEIKRLIGDGAKLDDIIDWLRQVGVQDISRSSLGRYAKNYESVAAEMRQHREMAAGFASELGAVEESEAHKVIVQMMHTLLMRSGMTAIKDGGASDPKDLMFFANALKSVQTSIAEREKLIEDTERRVRSAAAAAAGECATAAGISAETVKTIQHAVLGVAT